MSEGEFKKRILSMDIEEEDAIRVATILDLLDEAKKEFPIHFKMDHVSGDEYDAKTDSFTPQIVTTTYPQNLPLPEYTANAFIVKDEVIAWFLRWLGKQ